MKKFLLTSILISLLILLPLSRSEAVMQMIPPIQEIEAQRGRATTFTITVNNVGDEGVPSKFVAYDMDISVDGRPEIADSTIADSLVTDSTSIDSLKALLWQRGCGKWITLEPAEVFIKAHESITLTGTINFPMDADGSYYTMIKGMFVTTDFESEDEKDKQQIKLESQAGVVVLVTIPSSRNRALIYPDTILVYPMGETEDSPVFGSGHETGWSVVLPVKNDGNVHTQVSGSVSFWTAHGTKIETAELRAGKGYVFPGRIRNFKAEGSDFLSDGYFMIRINLRNSMGMNVTKSFPFAIYEGDVYPGALTDELKDLLRMATPTFRLKRPFFTRDVSAGGSSFMAIQMQNISEDTTLIVPRLADWTLTETGGGLLVTDPNEVSPRSCKSWLEFTEDEFTVPPGRNKSFKMRVNVPQDAAGEYYAAIVFDLDSANLDLPEEFMNNRMQMIALATTKGIETSVEVDSIDIEVLRDPNLTVHRFHFKVHNTGNAHCYVQGNMSLEKEIAKELYEPVGKIQEFGNPNLYILPNGERSYFVDIPNLEPGKYRSVLAVSFKQGEQPVVKYQLHEFE